MADGGLGELRRLGGLVLDEVERAVVGKRDALELVLLGLLADGHVLLDELPGPGQDPDRPVPRPGTSLRFARVQFTPDLMPSDVTGSSIYNQRLGDFGSGPGRCSPTCCSPTRSTAPRPRPRPPCWRRCRSGR